MVDSRQYCPHCSMQLSPSVSPRQEIRCGLCNALIAPAAHGLMVPSVTPALIPSIDELLAAPARFAPPLVRRPLETLGEGVGGVAFGILCTIGSVLLLMFCIHEVLFVPSNIILALLGVVGSVLGIFLGKAMLVDVFAMIDQMHELRDQGRLIQATVFDRWKEKDSDGSSMNVVAYAFQAHDSSGNPQLITIAQYHNDTQKQVKVGDVVWVRYLPRKPDICQIVLKEHSLRG